jgi:MoxR-like ATPase
VQPQPAPPSSRDPRDLAAGLFEVVAGAVRGKPDEVRLALVALFAGGHLLVEDVPGTGKTLLAKSLAGAIGGRYKRVQCTPDLLPADVTGTTVYGPATGAWEFRPGPVFANVVLVDEVNRASPRTQAALLEPMEERQVTVDGATHALPDPFFVVATQNPAGAAGTFPLPESQLDRFSIACTIGLPAREAEREILSGRGGTDALDAIEPITSPDVLADAIASVRHVHCAASVIDYVLDVAQATRDHHDVVVGASPRASLGLLHAARRTRRSWAATSCRPTT